MAVAAAMLCTPGKTRGPSFGDMSTPEKTCLAPSLSDTSCTKGKRLSRKTTIKVDTPVEEIVLDMQGSSTPIKAELHSDEDMPTPPTDKKLTRARRAPREGKSSSAKAPKAAKSRAAKVVKPVDEKPKDEKPVDKVEQISRRITQQCPNIGAAGKIISALRRSIGQPTTSGHVFTQAEVEEAWCKCLSFYNEEQVQNSDGSSDSSSASDAEEGSSGSQERKQARASRQKRDAELLESFMVEEAEEELSGEEEVDDEENEDEEAPGLGFCVQWPPKNGVVEIDDGYPVDAWASQQPELLPGSEGFNKRCTSVMKEVGIAATLHTEFQEKVECPPLQPHQESVAFLLHPKSPVTRLLVDHPTGSGKTWEIIKVLDNYFHDPRPKVPIFPKSPVCRNFYAELLRWPNRYRDYFCCMRPAEAALASGCCDWREKRKCMWNLAKFLDEELRLLCYTLREVLEMKRFYYMGSMHDGIREEFLAANPGEEMPSGPMRALSYTSAGGAFTRLREEGDLPRSAMMKIGYTQGCANPYTNKVVVMDEAHNLVRTQTKYGEELQCLRDLLVKANHLVLAGFTGTPICNKPEEGRQLLDIIKGVNAPAGDEGYMSSFPMRPQKLFPVSLPRGIPDAILTKQLQHQVIVPVELNGESLRVYDKKRRQGITNSLLSAYCNVCAFFGTFHDGTNGTKDKICGNPDQCAPKLMTIAAEVADQPQKSLVLIRKQSGYAVMLELMRQVAARANPPFGVATIDELTEFNHVSNIRGEKFRVLIADSVQCSEGVSFLAVRRVFLADVPSSPSQLVQQCGRSIRMFGHRGLPEEEQVVVNRMYIATFPKWFQAPLAGWAFRLFRHVRDGEGESYAKKMIARLKQAGVNTLEDMKAQIDAHGETKRKTLHPHNEEANKEELNLEEVQMFLELVGMWDENKPSAAPKTGPKAKARHLPQVVSTSARFSALAHGSERLAALMDQRVGAAPPKAASGNAKKTQGKNPGTQLKESVRAAGRSLADANRAFKSLEEAVTVVHGVCEQIDKFTPQILWQVALEQGLTNIRQNECVSGALKAAANPSFKAKDGDLKELTAREAKQLLHYLQKAEKVMGLSSAYLAVKEFCTELEQLPETEGDEEKEEELKVKIESEIGTLLQREAVQIALREVAPAAYVARGAGGLRQLGMVQIRALRDALERQRSSDRMAAAWSPQTLVRALRDLYQAASLDDAVATLESETADEAALQRLSDRTAEFVPALQAMREKAIDYQLLVRFGDPSIVAECDDAAPDADMDADEEGQENPEEGDAPERVSLPANWKLEWVHQIRGKAKEQYRFVDPEGRKYYSVLELRTALSGGIKAVDELRKSRQQTRQVEAGEKAAMVRSMPLRSGARKKSRW